MRGRPEVLDEIRSAAPPRQWSIDAATRGRLATLTAELVTDRPEPGAELQRYLSVRHRAVPLPEPDVAALLRGRALVVTGGSGCIGTVLLRQIRKLCAARLISADIAAPEQPVPGVEYVTLDVRAADEVERFFDRYRPEVVFHLAAQRDPGLAERSVTYTIETNVLGTAQVAWAAERTGVRRFVYASTGKALRPYSRCVYTGSKRVSEWLMADVARRGRMACSGARFTHVVDNAIVLDRLRRWCEDGDVVRLHSPDTVFYVQSALESAQLLLAAAAAPVDDAFRLYAIRDLGWPVSLLDLALDVISSTSGTAPNAVVPLYLAGNDPGYEESPYAGLYDPALSGDVSPLLNAIEAHQVDNAATDGAAVGGVDAAAAAAYEARHVVDRLPELRRWCRVGAGRQARRVLDEIGWDLLVLTIRATSPVVLDRIARLTAEHRPTMNGEHRRIDDVIRRHALRMPASTVPAEMPPAETVPAAGTAALTEVV